MHIENHIAVVGSESLAQRRLATALESYRGADAVVLALPRGGVPVGYEVARALRLPVILLTTFDDTAAFDEAVRAGAKGFLLKAISPETLAQARDAAEAVEIEYRSLPAVTEGPDAIAKGAPQLHDNVLPPVAG